MSHSSAKKLYERKKFSFGELEKRIVALELLRLSFDGNGTAGQPQHARRSAQRGVDEARVFAFGNLLLYAFHQSYELSGFLISLGLFAHFLEVLRSVGDTIRHGGKSPY
jgi:hypothetical protein